MNQYLLLVRIKHIPKVIYDVVDSTHIEMIDGSWCEGEWDDLALQLGLQSLLLLLLLFALRQ